MISAPPAAFTIRTAHAFVIPYVAQVPRVVHHAPVARKPRAKPRLVPAARPYDIYDSTTASALPADHADAVYADGAYAASPSEVPGHHRLWIDVSGGDPNANALDVERGDASPDASAGWVDAHLRAQPHSTAIIYTARSNWPAVEQSVGTLPLWERAHVRYWIADPTGVRHVVPGSSATQWYWGKNYDISTANPNFEH